jgi:hypothetical protein
MGGAAGGLRGGGLPATYGREPTGRGCRRRSPAPPPAGSRHRAATNPQRRSRTESRAVLRSPGSLSPAKITIKGAPKGASLARWHKRHP